MEALLRKQAVDLSLSFELLQLKLNMVEAGRKPDAEAALRVGKAFSLRMRRPYTVSRVCRVWGLSRSTVCRALQAGPRVRRAVCAQDREIAGILEQLIRETPFPAERHRKLWAKLRRRGIEISRERVRRILDEFALLPPYLGGLIKASPNEMWGIDSAKLRTNVDGEVKILFVVEHCTLECLAVAVVREETTVGWKQLLASAIGHGQPWRTVEIRMDNLPLFRSPEFGDMLKELNLRPSFISILRPQSNGIAERFVRLLRENLLRTQTFDSERDVARAVREFRNVFNKSYMIGRFDYRSPLEQRKHLQELGLHVENPVELK